MDTMTLIMAVLALVFGVLWMIRRRSRLRSDKFD